MIEFTQEQKIIVTGASSGIGEGTALLLNKQGATVIGLGRDEGRLAAMREKCAHPENCFIEVKDLTADIAGLPDYVKSLKEKYGKFSGLALCHGITAQRPMQLVDYDTMRNIFDVNYFSTMMFTKGFIDRRNNIGRGASVVAISSYATLGCNRGHSEYAGTKSALSKSMKCIAREVVGFGVRINTVSPSDILTPMTAGARHSDKVKDYPFGFGEVSDVANMIAYLLSNEAKWITGQDYVIDCLVGTIVK
jgi:NAD(P)-dependent dehydrogenase (short-subunit alcohol dehydrogenase family)